MPWVKHVTVNIFPPANVFECIARARARTRVVAAGAIFDGHQPLAGLSSIRVGVEVPFFTKLARYSV